tara:strand:+ start:875 stop:1045 length:171 start_codon:yes stop_codon:yes gene_type:complete
MIYNHTKSWNTQNYHRDGMNPMHGFFMAKRRLTCPEKQERRIVIDTENKNSKEIII